MKKVFLVMLDRERDQGLKALRRLGLVHPVPVQGSGAGLEAASAALEEARRAVGILEGVKLPKGFAPEAADEDRGLEVARAVNALSDEEKRLYEEAAALAREADRIAPWGDFDPGLVGELRDAGLELRLVSGPARALAAPPEGWSLVPFAASKDAVRVILAAPPGTPFPESEELREFALPERSLALVSARGREVAGRLAAIGEEYASLAAELPSAKARLAKTERDHRFETLRSGLEAEGAVAWLEGYLPAADYPRLSEEAARRGWGLLADDPADDEAPPTKVESNALVRIIQPIFEFLGTVPGYREYDISGLFLFFFSFFFAMIFGDGGYGSIMLAAALVMALKAKAGTGRVPDMLKLVIVLALSTVAWGVATASWFGIPFDALPALLRNVSIPWINGGNSEATDNVKVLCFAIGTVQLVIAHVKNIRRDWPSPKMLGQLGQFAMVAGMFFMVLNLVISQSKYPIPSWSLALIGGGFAASFVFSNYDGSRGFLKGLVGGVLASLANIVSVFLGVVNVFADIVSYIRLWAVGLAGVAISQTVNNMAGPMLGSAIMAAAGVALLLFGHGLNMIMAVLSVIVHGVRLNVLEFSSHLGMEWSGYKYEPFRDTAPADRAE
ncbi:MAG TPA: V-type ATPase 116kDa subunit family protein [Spirochaetales bacterium]|nr:V-type ATPase 116kDa subunit family protein [Spirochaetales bacterium]